jgi:hypothetical protein
MNSPYDSPVSKSTNLYKPLISRNWSGDEIAFPRREGYAKEASREGRANVQGGSNCVLVSLIDFAFRAWLVTNGAGDEIAFPRREGYAKEASREGRANVQGVRTAFSSLLSISRFARGSITDGAGDETRTRDINLGKVALYQLSYTRV